MPAGPAGPCATGAPAPAVALLVAAWSLRLALWPLGIWQRRPAAA